MAQGAVTGEEKTVVEHDRVAPPGRVDQQDVVPRGLADELADAGVLGLDGGVLAHGAPEHLAYQVAHALDAGGGTHIAYSPLHGARLQGDAGGAVEVGHQLAAPDVHLCAEVGGLGAVGGNRQVAVPLDYLELASLRDNFDVVVVLEVIDLKRHGDLLV